MWRSRSKRLGEMTGAMGILACLTILASMIVVVCQGSCRAGDIEKRFEDAQKKFEKKMFNTEADFQLYLQMRMVNNWLSQYAVWNRRWPGPIHNENAAINQLCELVPNNPYRPGQIQEASGRSTDPDYRYYSQPLNEIYDSRGASGFSNKDSMVPDNSYEAYGRKKIRLIYNPSLTILEVEGWEENPPDSWKEPPGTITGISNSTNLIVVWGAGADGRPIKVPGSSKIRLFISNIKMNGYRGND